MDINSLGKSLNLVPAVLAAGILMTSCATTKAAENTANVSEKKMLIRISEIEIYPEYQEEYILAARNVGETSVREEPGVIAIYPMIQQRNPCQIRILEIYADQEAYKSHINTAHFQEYKQGTLEMVKSLDLVDMNAMNENAMPSIFRKLAQ